MRSLRNIKYNSQTKSHVNPVILFWRAYYRKFTVGGMDKASPNKVNGQTPG
jgi:hypothetical protein